MQKILFILFFCSLVIVVSAEIISLTNGESINGKIVGFNDQKIYLGSGKTLFIISSSMISEIVDDQNISINIDDIPDLYHGKPNYNAFHEFKEIKPKKPPKLFHPKYSSKKYDNYDHHVNRMFMNLTARTLEKRVSSLSFYDIFLWNYCLGLSNKVDLEAYSFTFCPWIISGVGIKYNFYRDSNIDLSLSSLYRYYNFKYLNPFLDKNDELKGYSFPQRLLVTYGDIDNFISAGIGINPGIYYEFDKIKHDSSLIYNFGIVRRTSKWINIFTEISSDIPFIANDRFKENYDFNISGGIRYFWKKNSLELGVVFCHSKESNKDIFIIPSIHSTILIYNK
ncbi:MAG: hypothetical protein KAW88_06055 [Candidatus Cloacimonetes bacterium]|nr:hypothetical protein [Candidatus Cloacimonadota bacterium]